MYLVLFNLNGILWESSIYFVEQGNMVCLVLEQWWHRQCCTMCCYVKASLIKEFPIPLVRCFSLLPVVCCVSVHCWWELCLWSTQALQIFVPLSWLQYVSSRKACRRLLLSRWISRTRYSLLQMPQTLQSFPPTSCFHTEHYLISIDQ